MCSTRETREADPGSGVVQQYAGMTSLAYISTPCAKGCVGELLAQCLQLTNRRPNRIYNGRKSSRQEVKGRVVLKKAVGFFRCRGLSAKGKSNCTAYWKG
jgi:hypothetical protein